MPPTPSADALRDVIEADRAHVWHHLAQHKPFETVDPRVYVKGKGLRLWDAAGRELLDAVSGGVWTVNVGYGRESIADAVRDQLLELNYFAGASGSIPGARLARRLTEKTPGLTRVYYGNSGSEANEKAVKMVRQIAHRHHGGRKYKILYRERATTTAPPSAPSPPAATPSATRSTARWRPASSRSRTASSTAASGALSSTTASAPPTPSRR